MKLIVSRKVNSAGLPAGADPINIINSGIGNKFKAVPDNQVDEYVQSQALRGYVCFTFDHTGTFQSQTTVVNAAAAVAA